MRLPSFFDAVEEQGKRAGIAEGRLEGRREGRREGGLTMLFSLVDDGLIPISAASAKVGMTETEFIAQRSKMNQK